MKVALVCVAKNEEHYIQEWIDYNKKLGFDDIFIYTNDWDYSNPDPNIHIHAINGVNKQTISYKHFLSNHRTKFNWVAFFDVDEFLVLKKHNNIKEFLTNYQEHKGVGINWVLFGDNNQGTVINNNYSVLERFTKRQQDFNPHIKSIVNLDVIGSFNMGVHYPNTPIIDTKYEIIRGSLHKKGSLEIAQINHYFCKTYEEFLKKVERGRADMSSKRLLSDFDVHNTNHVDDFSALDFFRKKN
jgi:hypothetical protein